MSKLCSLPLLAGLNGFAAVLLGALGAHALQSRLEAGGAADSWQVASQYHLAHALGVVALLAWAAARPGHAGRLHRVAGCWLVGCLLFSGSIYLLALGGPRVLGPVTPLGGLAFLAGWALLALEGLRKAPASSP